jgi:hypothetical protein
VFVSYKHLANQIINPDSVSGHKHVIVLYFVVFFPVLYFLVS